MAKLNVNVEDYFPRIQHQELKSGDIFLLYNGNKLTEAHGEWMRRKKYGHINPAPYHAFIHYDVSYSRQRNLVLDTEIRTTLSFLEMEYMTKKNIRIDVIRYPLTPEQANIIMNEIEIVGGREPYYGVRRFAGYIKQVWGLGWLGKLIEPKGDKELVCSNRVARFHYQAGNPVSYIKWQEAAPADLGIFAVVSKIPELFTLKKRGEVYVHQKR